MYYKSFKTMRWFGENDQTSLIDIKQAGAAGIVTALHHIPVGEVWPVEEIQRVQKIIEDVGLVWSVVESLPVSEAIKRGDSLAELHIENYKQSIRNLAACGISTVTYNFMPVLDWVRTNHNYLNNDNTEALLYDQVAFTYFDTELLQRPGAEADYATAQLLKAKAFGATLTEADKEKLFSNVLLGLPGSTVNFTKDEVLQLLNNYKNIDNNKLRLNLISFLKRVVPVASECNVVLAIHPDDPPFSVLGLPRIVSSTEDLRAIFNAVPDTANGLCYCTGSLGALAENNLIEMVNEFAERIHFLHLRNIKRENEAVFRESHHLEGDNDITTIMEKLLLVMQNRKVNLPLRPDHGFLHDMEQGKKLYPGYSLIGRLKGLAELSGLELGLLHGLNKSDV